MDLEYKMKVLSREILVRANMLFQHKRHSTHGHHQMVNTEIRFIIFLLPKMEKLYTVSKNKAWS